MKKKLLFVIVLLFAATSVWALITPVYVNGGIGNDGWDGSSPTWVSGTIGPKATITAGISAVSIGGIVNVAAGTYTESVLVNKTVTLIGAQAGVPGFDVSRPAINESVITQTVAVPSAGVYISANGAVVDGFIIEKTAPGGSGVGVGLSASTSGYEIRNNIIRNNTMGLYLASQGTNQTKITGNYFLSNNVAGSASGDAIYGDQRAVNILVDNNRFFNNTSGSLVFVSSVYGPYGPFSNATISNNTFLGKGPAISGQAAFYNGGLNTDLQVLNNQFNGGNTAIIGLRVLGVDYALIKDNTFTGYTETAIDVQYLSIGVTIENNFLTNSARGVYVRGWMSGADVVVHYNSITNSSVAAIENKESEAWPSVTFVDATCNWYGTVVSSAIAAKIIGSVNFLPFLTDGTDNQPSTPGFQPVPSSCNGAGPVVDITNDPDNSYMTIQAAIDASTTLNGDVITVAAGTYNENVTVNKSLTLTGASSASVIVTALVNTQSVFTVTANNVTMSGFTAKNTLCPGNQGYAGILLVSGVTGCNIHDNILTNTQYGILILDPENSTIPGNNTFTNNNASNNCVSGIEMQHSKGNTFTNNTANSNSSYGFRLDGVSYNTFTGNTANSNGQNGFSLVKGSSTSGCINNNFKCNTANLNTQYGFREDNGDLNTLTSNTFNSNVLAGLRLKEVLTNLTVKNNNITGSPIGIDIAAPVTNVTTWTVTNNNIFGNTTYGISNLGTGTLNATNNWWGNASGPYHPVLNPTGTGNAVSDNVTFNPRLNGPISNCDCP